MITKASASVLRSVLTTTSPILQYEPPYGTCFLVRENEQVSYSLKQKAGRSMHKGSAALNCLDGRAEPMNEVQTGLPILGSMA